MGQELKTGTLRSDIELIRPGGHGDFPMLFDPQADAYYKISSRMMQIIGYLDRSRPVDEFLTELDRFGVPAERAELLQLLAFLQQNNLLAPEYGQIGVKREKFREMREQTWFLRFSSAYLFFRLPPWRPEKFLNRIRPLASPFASKYFLGVLLLPALIGYLLVIRDFGAVRTMFLDSLSWAGLAKYFAAILLLKFIHEAAHAIAATRFGCRIRGIGIGFMVFYPRLYTDTTDSWRLPRKQRLLIDGAGIIIELLLGGIAALLWSYLPPGAGRSTMFYIFAVSTISTIFVNGNPLIRYDGYYILCDLTGIENLMSRSSEYLKQFWRWHFLKLGAPPREARGGFLLAFGAASFVYRIFLYTSIILIIYHKFVKAVALLLLVLELYSICIYPIYREFRTVRQLSKRSANRARFYLAGAVLLLTAGILFLPLSWNIELPGEVIPAERRLVTVTEPGYLATPLPRRPFRTEAGELLVELASPQLEFNTRRLTWTMRGDRALFDLQQVDKQSFPASDVSWEKLRSDRIALEELERRRGELTVRAEFPGWFIPKYRDLSAGLYLNKGQTVGEVVSERLMVQAYATDREIDKLFPGQEVVLTVPDSLACAEGKIRAVNPIPARLRNSPLLQQFGGPIPVYADDRHGRGEYPSVLALYRIEIEFESAAEFASGRTLTATVRHRDRLADRIRTLVLSALRKEF